MLNDAISKPRMTLSDSDLTAMGRRAFDDLLGHLRVNHDSNLDLGQNIRLNRCITDMLWLLRIVGQPFRLQHEICEALRKTHGWDEQRIVDVTKTMDFL